MGHFWTHTHTHVVEICEYVRIMLRFFLWIFFFFAPLSVPSLFHDLFLFWPSKLEARNSFQILPREPWLGNEVAIERFFGGDLGVLVSEMIIVFLRFQFRYDFSIFFSLWFTIMTTNHQNYHNYYYDNFDDWLYPPYFVHSRFFPMTSAWFVCDFFMGFLAQKASHREVAHDLQTEVIIQESQIHVRNAETVGTYDIEKNS